MPSQNAEPAPSARLRIGVVVNNIEGHYQTQIIQGIRDFARDRGLQTAILDGRSLGSPFPEDHLQNEIYQLAGRMDLDGLLIVAGSLGTNSTDAELERQLAAFATMPVVTLGRIVKGYPGTRTGNASGILDAVHHLVANHGRRRLSFLSGPANDPDSIERLAAFRQGLADHGLSLMADQVYYGDYSFRCCPEIARRMLAGGQLPFDGLVCASDEMAINIQRALEPQGFRVPQDYALVGFDDLDEAAFRTPALSTIHQRLYEQSLAAGELLLQAIAGTTDLAPRVLPCHFIWRESCGCSMVPLVHPGQPARAAAAKPPAPLDAAAMLARLLEETSLKTRARAELARFIPALIDGIQLDLRALRDPPLFLLGLNEWLELTFAWDRYPELWHLILRRLRQAVPPPPAESREAAYLAAVFDEAYTLLVRRVSQRHARRQAAEQDLQTRFRDLSRRLNTAATREEIIRTLSQHLPDFGIAQAFIALAPEGADSARLDGSLRFLALSGIAGPAGDHQGLTPAAGAWAPPQWREQLSADELVYLPLVSHDRLFGYLMLSGQAVDPLLFSMLQEETAQALYVADLFALRQKLDENRLLAIAEHRKSEERYKEMALMVPMLMWETDGALGVSYLNQAATESLGLKPGDSLRSLLSVSDRQKADACLRDSAGQGDPRQTGIRIKRPDGRGTLLVQQLSVIRTDGSGGPGLRWHALDPSPLLMQSTFPDQSFFAQYQISGREREIMLLLVQGYKAREIAERLAIAESTVKGHVSHIYDKFGVDSRDGLVARLKDWQVQTQGYGSYLFMVLNQLIAGEPDSR